MRSFAIFTLGCKVNQYESQQVRELLQQLGLYPVALHGSPDLVVINTCCVTAAASAKCRQYIHKAQRLNPASKIVIFGCLPSVQTDETGNLGPNITLIRDRQNLISQLRMITKDTASIHQTVNTPINQDIAIKPENNLKIKPNTEQTFNDLPPLKRFIGQTRAFLKVQDGCDGYCAYCIIPHARPHMTSKPIGHAVKEAQRLTEAGHKEIVITGIFLGAYGQDTVKRHKWHDPYNPHLCALLESLAAIPALPRLRLSSLEPADITNELLDILCHHRTFMPHLHLSLQSGSDPILRRMHRQYTVDDFRRVVDRIQSRLDHPAITTDIIVGFPGETEADFEKTGALAEQIGFAKMHIFPFSARQGTLAARMPDRIALTVIQQRAQHLRTLDEKMGKTFRRQFIGQTANILIEGCRPLALGHSERYFKVYIDPCDQTLYPNDLVTIRLTDHYRDGLIGYLDSHTKEKNESSKTE